MTALNILLISLMLATAGVLVTGIAGFIQGGEFNRKYGNRLMRARVLLQLAAVIILAIIFMTAR
jgi:hypothetical protein